MKNDFYTTKFRYTLLAGVLLFAPGFVFGYGVSQTDQEMLTGGNLQTPAVDYFINHRGTKSTENYNLCSPCLRGENFDMAERTRTYDTASVLKSSVNH